MAFRPPFRNNAIKLSGRTFLAPPMGEARRYVANDFLNLIALPSVRRGENRGLFLTYDDGAWHEPTYTIRLCDLIRVFLIVCFAF